jgi:hypothetical protein
VSSIDRTFNNEEFKKNHPDLKKESDRPIAEIKSVEDIIEFVDKYYDEIKYKGKIKDNVLVIN